MQRIYGLLIFVLICLTTTAQEKNSSFLDKVNVTLILGSDNFRVDKDKWRNVWKNSSRPVPYDTDSLNFRESFLRCGLRLPRLDKGLRVQVAKDLFVNNPVRLLNRKISINAGLAYTRVRYNHDILYGGDGFYFPDTSRVYTVKTLVFEQFKSVLEFNQSLQYKFNSFLFKGVEYFMGIGYVIKMELANKINEDYTVNRHTYNSSIHNFREEKVLHNKETVEGKTTTTFQLLVPVGFTKRLSDVSRLLIELDYTFSKNKYTDVYKKNEAYAFHFGYMYNFNQ